MARLSQEQTNKILIWAGYVLVVSSLLGLALCRILTFLKVMTHEQLDGITNDLSWLALTLSGLTFLLQALTRRDIDES